jgi:hypothetical protein
MTTICGPNSEDKLLVKRPGLIQMADQLGKPDIKALHPMLSLIYVAPSLKMFNSPAISAIIKKGR